ncbi:MAG: carbon storage regulator CsrA [Acidimicrobiales bacterium]
MLVLSRRSNESIVINGDVVVTILEIRGDQVRIGIRAPRSVTVHREEVHAEIQRANQSAASVGSVDVSRLPKAPPSS